jgi:hypothetical protein
MNIHSLIRCTLINFLFFTVNPTLADATSNEAYLKLTDEMRDIVDRNQKNFDSTRSTHGTIKIISTNSFYHGKGSRVAEETVEFWYDGSHSRTDLLKSKFIGKETDPLLLEYESTDGTAHIIPRSIGLTDIRSIESNMFYYPSRQTVFITPPKEEAGRDIRQINFFYYQTIMGRTLKEEVLRLAEHDQYFTVKNETADGDDCLLLEHHDTEYDITTKIWIVPSKGYCIKKRQVAQKGEVRVGYTTTLKEYLPGIWWFDSVKAINLGGPEGINPDKKVELSVELLTLNKPIDPKTFTLAGTNVPYGTRVQDDISGLRYVYGTGYKLPQDVDLALAAIEDSMERPVEETADLTEKPSQKETSKSKSSTEGIENNDPNLMRNAHTEKTGSGFLLSVGLGSGLALSVIAILFIKRKKGK